MKPTTYRYSVPFTGTKSKALDIARVALLSLGFEIVSESDNELDATGPGMHSNQQPDLLGATQIHFDITATDIYVDAVLGGVNTMKKFVYFFPPGLIISLMLFGALFGQTMQLYFLLFIIPWAFIAPIFAKTFERTTTNAIDRLVRGMAQASKSSKSPIT